MKKTLSFHLKGSFRDQLGNVNLKHGRSGSSITKTLNISQSGV